MTTKEKKKEQKKKVEQIAKMSNEEKAYRLLKQQMRNNIDVLIRLKDK